METSEKTIITPISEFDKTRDKHAYVIFLSGPLMGKIHLLEEGEITLGRGTDVDIPINDLGISRLHASIAYKKGEGILKDHGSTNGTYLNGKKVTGENPLKDGDKIQVSASTIFKYAYQDKVENIFHNELYKMAVVDALTGTYNKRYFEERLNEEFSYCLRNNLPLSLVAFDIDHFKKINDTHGHPAGDYVLGRLSQIAKSVMRSEDLFARCGGEEFGILLKTTDAAGALIQAERLRKLIDESRFEFEGKKIHVTVSIGVATLAGQNFKTWEDLSKLADERLYQSKNHGRNRVTGES